MPAPGCVSPAPLARSHTPTAIVAVRAAALLSALLGFPAVATAAAPREDEPPATSEPATSEPAPPARKLMIGIEGVIMQAPPLRTAVVELDPRFVGKSVALGGAGLFARYRLRDIVGFDFGVRSGSIRYTDEDRDTTVSQDQFLADAGVLLYLGRGEVAQFALSGGLGGMFSRVGYALGDGPDGRQVFGSGLVRVGAEAEFLVKRIAFVLSFRTYGVFTARSNVRNRGALLEGESRSDRLAPVATLQTYLVGAAGIAYRF